MDHTQHAVLFADRCNFNVSHGEICDVEKCIRTAKHADEVGSNALSGHPVQHFFTNSSDLNVIWLKPMDPTGSDCWISCFHFQKLEATYSYLVRGKYYCDEAVFWHHCS